MPHTTLSPPVTRADRRPRRVVTLVAAVVAALLVLAGCGGGAGGGGAAAPGGGGPFPVTIQHAFGQTQIPAAPQRVVTVGYNDADFALALGVVPVGVRDFVGAFDETNRPWAQQALGGQRPENVGGNELDIEKIAALQPDLILGVYSFMDQATYDTLSRIAPTVADKNPGGSPPSLWQEQTRITGQALGRSEQAEQVVAGVERRFADVKAQNPGFAGKPLSVDLVASNESYKLGADDLRVQLFSGMGFAIPPTTETLSSEQLSRLDGPGIAVVGVPPQALAGNPVFQNLSAVREGRVAYLGEESSPFAGALGFSSPLSLPYALDVAAPQLAPIFR